MIQNRGKMRVTLIFAFIFLIYSGNLFAQNNSWTGLLNSNSANGVNGNVYAITAFQNNIVVAGGFSQAGGINARNVAVWNGTTWSALGSGIGNSGDSVYALAVFNNELYAGGSFSSPSSNIVKWNGSSWVSVGSGVDGEVRALLIFNSALVAGGNFENRGSNIASWNGSDWSDFGQGFNTNATVYALAVFNSKLIAAGKINSSGSTNLNNIASWSGSVWQSMDSGIGNNNSDRVFALTVFNSTLIAGGRFSVAGGTTAAHNIARYTGSTWQFIGNTAADLDDEVDALAIYNGTLIVGGNFKFISQQYASRIASWTGTAWNRMVTGMEDKVNAISIKDSSLYAGGEFKYAGGFSGNHVSRYYNLQTRTISGHVTYSDNGTVTSGKVKAFRIDELTRELIAVDSSTINSNGDYVLPHCPPHTLRVMAFPNDELDFSPTYYPSTIDWRGATVVVPTNNQTNVNIVVFRVVPAPENSNSTATIGGHIYLNNNIPGNLPGIYPYQRDAILYVKQGSSFKRFAISHDDQSYMTSSLDAGTYDLYVYRSGYTYAIRNIVLGTANLDTVNFYLDTLALIGLHNISERVPQSFELGQNYPNPFNPVTSIKFSIFKEGFVKLAVYNILGQIVADLVNEDLKQGEYKYVFDAMDMPSGIYFYKLETGSFTETKKMVLLK